MSAFQRARLLGNVAALRLFEHLAESAWDWLGDARKLGLGFSEDTISDLAMLEIARSGLNGVDVRRVSKRQERLVGFDWLFVISRPGRRPTIYVVQAKKLKLDHSRTYSYGRLRYPAGSKYQIDALEEFANWLGAVPMYCFYNNVDNFTAHLHWHCSVKPPDVPQLGCTLVPLDVVRQIHNRNVSKNFHSIHRSPEALPWRCLFHLSCNGHDWDRKSGGQSAANNSRGMDRSLEFLSSFAPEDDGPIEWEDLVDQLDLNDLVNRYTSGRFVPTPDRILSLTLED